MTVLVTGGSGFVGLNLLEQLLARGETVVNLSLAPPPAAALRRFEALPGRLATREGDVRDPEAIAQALADSRAERVIHGAVITADAERERRDAAGIVAVNVGGTVNALEAARRHGVRRFVYLGSGAVYGANGFAAPVLDEETPPAPVSLYAITKYTAERISLRFRELWGLPLVVARLGGVFGRWEHDTGLRDTLSPPLLATRLAAEGREAVLGDEGRRDWIYAPDVAAGVLALLDADAPRHVVYNVAPGREWTVLDWCERLQRRFPNFRYRVADDPAGSNVRLYPASRRAPMSTARLHEDTGFAARYGLEEAFADYLDWWAATPW